MQQTKSIWMTLLSTSMAQHPTQIPLDDSRLFRGKTMRLKTGDDRFSQSDERSVRVQAQDQPNDQSLLTPARRAALDALEREFHDLLQQAALTRAA
jgi:hypothetical protein